MENNTLLTDNLRLLFTKEVRPLLHTFRLYIRELPKLNMKKTSLFAAFCFLFALGQAQVNKDEIQANFAEIGSSLASVKTMYLNNYIAHYTDGTSKLASGTYKTSNNNSFELNDRGIKMLYKTDSEAQIRFIPYDKIQYYVVGKDFMTISMMQ